MSENNEKFSYTYSSSQQQEIKKIREKYLPTENSEDKMELLRKLDASAEKPGTIISIIVGIVGTLVMGLGMCCCMLWGDKFFVLGIIIGLIGIAGVCAAYPLFTYITKKQREKIAPEIIRLTDELMK